MRTIFVVLSWALLLSACSKGEAPLNNAAALKAANSAHAKKVAEQDAVEEARQLKFVKAHKQGPAAESASAARKKNRDGKPPR